MWREDIVPKYKEMLVNLNKGNPFTYEMVRVAVTTGNANVEVAIEDKSFIGIWQEYIYHLQNDDNGKRYSTSDSYRRHEDAAGGIQGIVIHRLWPTHINIQEQQ